MHKRFAAFAALLLALSAQPTFAHGFKQGAIFIDHPMIQEAPPNARVLGGYITLQNNGTEDDRLLAIESPAAQKVELHQSPMALPACCP
jgi:copper(I)-binding protein